MFWEEPTPILLTGALVTSHLLFNEAVVIDGNSKRFKWCALILGECASVSCIAQFSKQNVLLPSFLIYLCCIFLNIFLTHFKFRLIHSVGPFIVGMLANV
jgi:hypothetical protein